MLLERFFGLKENGTTVKRELIAGFTNFMTISYIIFVQPFMLSDAGMDAGAVMVATCISSAIATFAMAFLTNYPVVLAPGMGLNAYFVYGVCLGLNLPWQEALGIVFIAGMLFFILSFIGIREAIMNAIPSSLQNAIAVGIGLFIAFIGLQMSGINYDGSGYVGNPRRQPPYNACAPLPFRDRRHTHADSTKDTRRDSDRYPCVSAVANLIFGTGKVHRESSRHRHHRSPRRFFKLQFPNIFAKLELVSVVFVFLCY